MLEDFLQTHSVIGVSFEQLGHEVSGDSRETLGPLDFEFENVVEQLLLIGSLEWRRTR